MDGTTIDDEGFEGLHPHARWTIRLGSVLGFALPSAGLALAASILLTSWLDIPRGALVATCVLLALLAGAWTGWRYAAASYARIRFRLDADGLSIRRGVWWRSETRVARSRVQHTDVNRGPLDRRLGLATLKVHTAGTRHASIELDGLDAERAVALRDALAGGDDDTV
jgi:membrane protein YdbS with pleckstrin-like domain